MSVSYPSPSNRIHVEAMEWGRKPGTDFWLIPRNEGELTGVTNEPTLADREWVTTSLVWTAGSGADFLDSSDVGTPEHFLTNASGDLLQSPAIFGGYVHTQAVARILGYTPTQLVCEFYASFTDASANETRSGFGLVEAGGTAGTDADAMAWIYSDGTNFGIRSAADSDAGAVIDNNWNLWRIVISSGSATDAIEWFINGTSQGTMDRQTDLWPCSLGMHALTTNRPGLAWAHFFYA